MDAQQILTVLAILLSLFDSRCESCQSDPAVNDYEMQGEIWLQWYSTDDPLDGEDIEPKTTIYNIENMCSGQPTDIECRTKYSKIDHSMTGQTVTCQANSGFLCRDTDQGGGQCYDYEIRFKCSDSNALPKPEYDLDLSGKADVNDMDPVSCDGTGVTVNDKIGPLFGTSINDRHYYQKEGPPNSDNACAMWPGQSAALTFLPLLDGICFSRPLCCSHGLTVEFWAYAGPQSNVWAGFFSTGGTHDYHTGMTVFITASQIRCETRFSLDNGDDKKMSLKAPEVLNAWYHVACVFDETDGSTYLYIDGTLIETKTPQPLFPEETVHYDDLRFFNRNKQPIANVRSSTSTDAIMSDMRVYFYYMGQSEVTELLRRQTTGAFVHVYYIGRVSEQQYEQVVLECKGHGSDGNPLTFRWATSSDGLSFTLIDPSSDPSIYEYTAELNSYQSVSRLHIIDHPLTETIYSCEGYDPSTMATSSQMFSLTFDPEVTTWTPWMSSDEPDDNDDMETLGNVQANYPQVCSDPIDVECRTLYSKVNHSDTGQVFSKSCTTTEGLHCIGSAQTEGVCLDYEIRFLCSGVNYLWTSWYNDDTPSGSEESETLDNHKSQGHSDLCEFPLFAECRTVSDDTLWYNAANNQLTYPYICNKNGLLCTNSDNPSSCSDFKVRYACPYYSGKYPIYQWDLGGRSALSEEYPTDCGSLSLTSFLATYPGASVDGTSSSALGFTSADSSVNAHCAVILDGSNYLDLGYYSLDCVTDASRCTEGTTFSFWFKPLSASSASDVYFVSSGSHVEEGKGLTFSQLSGNGNYVITVKTRYHTWQATVSNSKFPLNVWTHIHISIDPPDGFKYYIGGTFEEHITTFSTSTYNIERSDAPRNLILGGRNNDYLENGHTAISDFRVYFSALQESHITAFTSCGDADGTVSVFSLTRTTHDLDFDLNIQCRVWGTPAPTLEWLLFDDIGQEGSPQVISSGVVITESNPAAGCWKISDLFIADYAYSVYANKTIICKAKNDVQHDVDSIEVEIPDACEFPLGVHSGNFRAVQFEDSVDGTLLAVPALDGNNYWVQADGSRMLTIDLGVKHTIVGIALQVHQSPSGSSYDASVTVNYMDATSTWQLFEVLNLVGIEDAATTFWFAFSSPQDTSKLQIHPSTFTTSTHLRIELSGCQIGALPHELNLTGGYDYMSNSYTALCQTASFPSVPVVWEYSGDVPESQRITENDLEGVTTYQSSLIIGEFEPGDDNFTITCNSTYAGITLSNSIQPEYGFSGTVTLSGPTSAVSGTMVMLSCDTSGDDLYNLDWYFIPRGSSLPEPVSDGLDGRSLSDPALIIPIGGTATLSIASFDPATHDGTYICSANNGTGSDSLSLAAYVLQGNITVTANDSYYDSGSNSFVLSCDFVYDGDFLNTSWILPGMMETYGNQSDPKYQLTNIEAKSLLVIKSFNFSTDDGFYTCKGYTSGSGEAEYQFDINYAFSGTITMNSSPTNILYGDTVVVTSTILGDDVFHLQWYYAEDNSGGIGNTLTETGNIDISDPATVIGNGGIATVTMTNFDPSHDGVYSIVVNNGSAIDSISLSGSYIAGNISVSGNTSYYLPASNTFVLTCDFIFDGQWLNVSWILPSTQEIFSNSSDLKYEVTSDCCSSPVTSFLSIYSFNYTMDDSSYTCKGYTNGGGEASLLHNINYAFSGTITMNSSPTNILYGDTVVVTATILGDDVFHLQWYYAEDNSGGIGNTLTETGNIDISDLATVIGNGGIATVTMTNFDPNHDGVFSIVVNNGSAIDSISLSGSYIAGNISVSGNTSYYLPASNTFVLTCDFIFDGQWLNVSWILPSTQEIFSNSSDLKYEITSDCCSSPVTSFLSIYSFNYTMDDSSYTCKGYTNGGGEASLLHNINYAFSGTITMNSSPTNILYGDTVVVTATILGDDVFHLQWYYAEDNSGGIGNTLTETGNIDISDPAAVIGNGGIATVTMTNFDPSHDGVYSIVVNNGSAIDSISLSGSYIAGNISVSGNTSYYLPASNTFVLTCDFIFDGQWLNVSWILPSTQEIFSNSTDLKYEITSDCCSSPVTSFLSIYSFNYTMDDSSYTCKGYTNGGGEASLLHNINYEFTGSVSVTMSDVVRGGPATITCTADGDTVYDILWQFMPSGSAVAVRLLESTAYVTSNSSLGVMTTYATYELVVDIWPSANDGTYICLVNQESSQQNVVILGATLDDILVSSSCDISTSICVLECQVAYTSIPPNVTWHAPPSLPQISSGDVIGRMSVTEAPLVGLITSSLIITDADPGQDNMNYTCQADLFSVTSLQNTTYLEIPIADDSKVISLDGQYNGSTQHYQLLCVVSFTGLQANITWMTPTGENITETQPGSKFTVMQQVIGTNITSELFVNSSDFSQDDGYYSCLASQDDIVKDSEVIGIFQAYSGPLLANIASSIRIGETVSLECVAGDPSTAFDIEWYHSSAQDGSSSQPLTSSSLHQITTYLNATDGLVSTLQIGLFSIPENGYYICGVNGLSKTVNLTIWETKVFSDCGQWNDLTQ